MKKVLIFFCFTILLLQSCSKADPRVVVTPQTFYVDYTGGTVTANFVTNFSWEISSNEHNIKCEPSSGGIGYQSITFTVPATEAHLTQLYLVTIKATGEGSSATRTFYITQDYAPIE
ncbi:MAG: BACON domain-containing protein [Bacteroidales bacterium]|nr:BACON domain-containing protein [Bacteroidales bacterium]